MFPVLDACYPNERPRDLEAAPSSRVRLLRGVGPGAAPVVPTGLPVLAVGEEVPVSPVRAIVLLRSQPAPARASEPRRDQARLSLPVPSALLPPSARRRGMGWSGAGGGGERWKRDGEEPSGWEAGGEGGSGALRGFIPSRGRGTSASVVGGGGQDAARALAGHAGAGLALAAELRFTLPLLRPPRFCTEGKRTFSSRLILEKHIQVRHGIKVTDQPKSQEVVISRIGAGHAQVPARGGPAGAWGGVGQGWRRRLAQPRAARGRKGRTFRELRGCPWPRGVKASPAPGFPQGRSTGASQGPSPPRVPGGACGEGYERARLRREPLRGSHRALPAGVRPEAEAVLG